MFEDVRMLHAADCTDARAYPLQAQPVPTLPEGPAWSGPLRCLGRSRVGAPLCFRSASRSGVVRRRMETIVHARTGVGTACRAPRCVPARRFLCACVCVRAFARARVLRVWRDRGQPELRQPLHACRRCKPSLSGASAQCVTSTLRTTCARTTRACLLLPPQPAPASCPHHCLLHLHHPVARLYRLARRAGFHWADCALTQVYGRTAELLLQDVLREIPLLEGRAAARHPDRKPGGAIRVVHL